LLVVYVTVSFTQVEYLRSRALILTLTQVLEAFNLAHKHLTWVEVADSDKFTG
jgi:hypothetical protein